MLILLTNDDGYRAAGLQALRAALKAVARVVTVAPAAEQSGVSHALTLTRPLSVDRIGTDVFAVDGTPADCVNLAVNALLEERPDACVSGINHGQNLGDDVTYSGTVGAAQEGTLFGIPSLAVSQVGASMDSDFGAAATATAALALFLGSGQVTLPRGTFLNLNVPSASPRGVSATHLARRTYENGVVTREDPRGRTYYWVGGVPVWEAGPGSDQHAVSELGHLSVSLLGTDLSRAVPGGGVDLEPDHLGPRLGPVVGALEEALATLRTGDSVHVPEVGP